MLVRLGHGLSVDGCSTTSTGGGSSPYLDDVIPSVCGDLDATIADSYSGSGQTWANLIASPADGSAQTDNDFWLGFTGTPSTDDPTFTGTPGDPAAYFNHDGLDYLTTKNLSAALTLSNAHKTDQAGTWIAVTYKVAPATSNADSIWGNRVGATDHALQIKQNGSLLQSNGSATAVKSGLFSNMPAATDVIIIVSWDGTATTNNIRAWRNSRTKTESSAAFGATTTAGSNSFSVMASNNGTGTMNLDTRLYGMAWGNAFIDDADAVAIIDHLNARHERTYA